MLSAYIELSYADALLSDGRGRVGYLLKDRVTSLEVLVESLKTIVAVARCWIPRSSPSCWSPDGPIRSTR